MGRMASFFLKKCKIVFISRNAEDILREKAGTQEENRSKWWDLNRGEDAFVGGRQRHTLQ